jgi:N-formylglutamate deformylase
MTMSTFATDGVSPFVFHAGTAPLLISIPHMGTYIPPTISKRLTAPAQRLPDTDWHLDRLYEFAKGLGASVLQATHSRYVVDLNRPPDNANLYPGQDTTGLCPVDLFDSSPLYLAGQAPSEAEILERREAIWRPYHHQLQVELARLRHLYPKVVLWDAHSIRSQVPRFFEGQLPDLNLGTANGSSCSAALADELLGLAAGNEGTTAVLNGRFKGGYITRCYGNPDQGIHAVQLEMTQRCYMDETWPFAWQADRAARVQPVLMRMIRACIGFTGRP